MSLRVELEPELEREFREKAMRVYGYSKGSIKKAASAAMRQWTESVEIIKKGGESKDPFRHIEGMLSHLRGKKTSVELQHEAMKIWAEEVD